MNEVTNSKELELAEETALADAGEASAVFLHELGNTLNNILLQAKLMQQQAPAELQPRLAETCKHIMHSAQNMKQLAQFRQLRRAKPYPVDINAVIRDIAAASSIEANLEDAAPTVKGSWTDVKRLIQLLIKNAAPSTQAERVVRITTTHRDNEIGLRVETDGIQVEEDALPQLFEPFRRIGSTPDSLELAICRELVRRMRGQLMAERSDGKLVYVAKWSLT